MKLVKLVMGKGGEIISKTWQKRIPLTAAIDSIIRIYSTQNIDHLKI